MKNNNPRYKTSREMPFQDFFPLRSDGKCRKCEMPQSGKQTSWCSKVCQDTAYYEVMIARGHPAYIRQEVFDRDDGICASCGADCKIAERISIRVQHAFYDWISYIVPFEDWFPREVGVKSQKDIYEKEFYRFARKLLKDSLLSFGSSCWHADHITELAAGGKNELGNFQTLCLVCHKKKTRIFVQKGGAFSRKKRAKNNVQNEHEKDAQFSPLNR
jgi:5-methylcytosine-specific restriction endonuclease McrA